MCFKTILIASLLALLFGFRIAVASQSTSQPPIPKTPAGQALQAYLDAFNSGDRSRIQTYVKNYDQTQTVDGLLSFRSRTGGFTLLAVDNNAPDTVSFRVRANAGSVEAYGTLALASTSPPKVKLLSLHVIPPGTSVEHTSLDPAERQWVIAGLTEKLRKNYGYPDMAAKTSATLDANQKKGTTTT